MTAVPPRLVTLRRLAGELQTMEPTARHRPDDVTLRISPYDHGDVAGVAVTGDVDIASIPVLERRLDDAIRESQGVFVVDLAEVGFMDSSGLRLLLRARSLLARDERALAIIAPQEVRRLLEVAGVADLLSLFDSRDDVSSHLVPAR